MDRGAWQATAQGVAKSRTQLSNETTARSTAHAPQMQTLRQGSRTQDVTVKCYRAGQNSDRAAKGRDRSQHRVVGGHKGKGKDAWEETEALRTRGPAGALYKNRGL